MAKKLPGVVVGQARNRELVTPNTPPPEPGWTTFEQQQGIDKIFYVSDLNGKDTWSGTKPEPTPDGTDGPLKTLSKGMQKLHQRTGYADWLLLRCGDTWNENIGELNLSGRSVTQPVLISSYGTGPRPQIRPDNADGVRNISGTVQYLAFVDLHLEPKVVPALGRGAFVFLHPTHDVLIEGCYITGFEHGINYDQRDYELGQRLTVRRNVIVDTWRSALYLQYAQDVLLHENVIQRNGLINLVQHAMVYCDTEGCTGFVATNNILADAHTVGLHMRAGGLGENNLVIRCPISISYGGGDSWSWWPSGVAGDVRDNVILDGSDIPAGPVGGPRGWGIHVENANTTIIENNIVANCWTSTNPNRESFGLEARVGGAKIWNVTLQNNVVYGWGGKTLEIHGYPSPASYTNTTISFAAPNTINDSAGQFVSSGFLAGQHVTVSGAGSNNGVYLIGAVTPTTLTVSSGISTAGAGASVTLAHIRIKNIALLGNDFQNDVTNNYLMMGYQGVVPNEVTSGYNRYWNNTTPNSPFNWFDVGLGDKSLATYKANCKVPDTTSTAYKPNYKAPFSASVAAYYNFVKGVTWGTHDDFMAECRTLRKGNWNLAWTAPVVNEWMRRCFEEI